MNKKSIYTLALLAPLFLSVQSVRASDTDETIVAAAKNSYVFKTFLKTDDVTTKSNDGAVTLTGTVADASRKALAEDTVTNLPGVRSVDNQLKIKTEAAADNGDWFIALKIKNMLMFHRNVSAFTTEVNSVDGAVTLTGEASSLAQKELTTEYAKDVKGVKTVDNKMTVAAAVVVADRELTASEILDDASITAQIKAALMSHNSTSSLTTSVKTTNGIVTVGGVAKNEAEKSLVSKLVTNIHGVTRVVNDMTIPFVGTTSSN